MKVSLRQVCLIGGLLLVVGCNTSGTITKVVNDREIEVVAKESYVKAGDRVAIFKTECDSPTLLKGSKRRQCWNSKVGEGKVAAVANGVATVQADQAVTWSNDNFVSWSYSATGAK